MCGFVGFSSKIEAFEKDKIIKKMTEAIHHRGPDSDGFFTDDQVALGFRRLSIIDLSDEGSQPVYNENKDVVLVFNGEIYNYQALRETLLEKGHIFTSQTDSEVIVHGYEEYGVEILSLLRGMFAFAIWDIKEDQLLIARDFFGIKPLYYTKQTHDGSFLFGSEIKSFLQHPSFDKQFNNDALKPYLTFQYSAMEETFFKGVYKLKPCHYMLVKKGHVEMKSYHHHEFKSENKTLEENIKNIQNMMEESVKYHKISDVKVGSFLSGGVDSSYITALLKPDKTFSVGFQEYEAMFNETNHAKALSKALGIENHSKILTADECFDIIPTIQYHMDEPHSNPSSVPLYFLAELAKEHVTVVLSGEGADELFGGYPWYQTTTAIETYEKIPFALRKTIGQKAGKMKKNRLTKFLVRGGQSLEEKYIGAARVFDEKDALKVLRKPFSQGPTVKSITQPIYDCVKNQDDVTRMQYLDMHLWLPSDILLKADKMSMAHSLELRVPFLDKEVMKLASSLPTNQRVNKKDTKVALRKAALDILPEEWANRPKLGFPVPIRYWMREEKYYKMIKKVFDTEIADKFFDKEILLGYLQAHYKEEANYARYVWTVYVFLIWYDEYFVKR